MIKGSLQQVGVETQHVPSGRQEFCFGHQLQDNGLHALEERERGRREGERRKKADERKKKEKVRESKEKFIINVYILNLL